MNLLTRNQITSEWSEDYKQIKIRDLMTKEEHSSLDLAS